MDKNKNRLPLYSAANNLFGVVSSSDMTGLLPTMPRSEVDLEGYSNLAPIPAPERRHKGKGK